MQVLFLELFQLKVIVTLLPFEGLNHLCLFVYLSVESAWAMLSFQRLALISIRLLKILINLLSFSQRIYQLLIFIF